MAGSSTVFPFTEAMAERFTDEGYEGQITIDSIGSGAGFERFCVNAEPDISNASRPIKDEEREACLENGREALEFRVGTDALAVTLSQENDFVVVVPLLSSSTQIPQEPTLALFSCVTVIVRRYKRRTML